MYLASCYIKSLGDFKRGDTFAFYAKFKDDTGQPITVDINTLHSQVRNESGKLYATLEVREHPTVTGAYLFQASNETTSLWPGNVTLYIDIQIVENEIVTSTDTFSVNVLKDVTQNG